jgi:hypothetical protein
VLDDSVHDRYEAPLQLPVAFAAGNVERVRLTFEVAVVPADFNEGYYRPLIRFRGVDGNGAAVSLDKYTPSERVHIQPLPAAG